MGTTSPNAVPRLPFASVFAHSRIPMALVARDRRYVEVNDAALELYQLPREEIIGRLAGRTRLDNRAGVDVQWEQLARSGELYDEVLIAHSSGAEMAVSFAAHATTVDGQWLALIVTLSAHFEPDGEELIGTAKLESANGPASKLTDREREVVRHVALGCETRQIAELLGLSSETIRTHVRNAMVKTGAHTRAQLVAIVLVDGLIHT